MCAILRLNKQYKALPLVSRFYFTLGSFYLLSITVQIGLSVASQHMGRPQMESSAFKSPPMPCFTAGINFGRRTSLLSRARTRWLGRTCWRSPDTYWRSRLSACDEDRPTCKKYCQAPRLSTKNEGNSKSGVVEPSQQASQ